MSTTEGFHPLRGLFRMIRGLFVFACVLIATFAVIAYASGWIEVRHDSQQDKATIEVETGKAKQAAEDAVTKGKELIQDAGDKIEKLREQPAPQPDGTAAPDQVPDSDKPKDRTDAPSTGKRGD